MFTYAASAAAAGRTAVCNLIHVAGIHERLVYLIQFLSLLVEHIAPEHDPNVFVSGRTSDDFDRFRTQHASRGRMKTSTGTHLCTYER